MSIRPVEMWGVECDGAACGNVYAPVYDGEVQRLLLHTPRLCEHWEAAMNAEGWVTVAGRHLCPECVDAQSAELGNRISDLGQTAGTDPPPGTDGSEEAGRQ